MPQIAYDQALVLLRQGNIGAALQLTQQNDLPLMQARVLIARDEPAEALAVLEPLRQEAEAKGWAYRLLMVMAVKSVAHHAHGDKEKAMELLGEVLAWAEPEGFIRLFVDEGEPMRLLILDFRLWIEKQAHEGHKPIEYANKLLVAFTQPVAAPKSAIIHQKSDMIEPLSKRELEVLKLLRSELSGSEIAQHLIVSLNTLRTHTNNIYNKLGVNNRRAAVRRAEELDLL